MDQPSHTVAGGLQNPPTVSSGQSGDGFGGGSATQSGLANNNLPANTHHNGALNAGQQTSGARSSNGGSSNTTMSSTFPRNAIAGRSEISTLPLAPTLITKFANAGFRTVNDVLATTPSDLALELDVPIAEALRILKAVTTAHGQGEKESLGTNASDLLQQAKFMKPIVCFCRDLDQMLGGGIPRGQVTEIVGTPGVGKTQLAMQLCISVQIPPTFGGVAGSAVYIDTEGSFTPERVAQMADAALQHLEKTAASRRLPVWSTAGGAPATKEDLMANIHVFRVHDHVEQLATVRHLPVFLTQHPDVKLIVLDSVAFHFRHAYSDVGLRTRMLIKMAQQLNELANKLAIGVVIVNQMTTKVEWGSGGGGGGGDANLVPALGDSWAHACTNRMLLFFKGRSRIVTLIKSSRMPDRESRFIVDERGVRDDPETKLIQRREQELRLQREREMMVGQQPVVQHAVHQHAGETENFNGVKRARVT